MDATIPVNASELIGHKPPGATLTFTTPQDDPPIVAVGNEVDLLALGTNGMTRISGTVVAQLTVPAGEGRFFNQGLVLIQVNNEADVDQYLSQQIFTAAVPATLQVKSQPIYRWILQRVITSYE